MFPPDAMNQTASLSQPMNMTGPMGFTQSQIQNPTTSMPSQRQMPQNMQAQGLMSTVVSDSAMQVVSILILPFFFHYLYVCHLFSDYFCFWLFGIFFVRIQVAIEMKFLIVKDFDNLIKIKGNLCLTLICQKA